MIRSGIILLIIQILLMASSCAQKVKEKEQSELVRAEYVTYDLDGKPVFEILHFEHDSIVFMERTDSTGQFLKDHRAIVESPSSRTVPVHEPFKSNLYIYGPRPCNNLMYYVSEPILQGVDYKGKN